MRPTRSIALVLLRNETRLAWRSINPQSATLLLVLGGLLLTLGQLAALGLMLTVRPPGIPLVAEERVWALVASLMFGIAFLNAVQVVCERSDADLLLPAPIDPGLILFARWAGIAVSALLPAVLVVPAVNAAVLLVSAHYAGGYAVIVLSACAAGAVGIMGALGTLRLFGARRGRTAAQVLGALVSALVYLSFQLPQLLSRSSPGLTRFLAGIAENPLTRTLALAGRGAGLHLGILALVSMGLAFVTYRYWGRVLVFGYQEAATATKSIPPKGRVRPMDTRLSQAAFRKDVRLILRDPLLIAQSLPSVLYIFPAMFVLVRDAPKAALGASGVVVAGQFSSILAAVLASGEEGWDLMRMSPAPHRQLMYSKLAAALVAPLGGCLLCSVALAALGHPLAALYSFIAGILVAVPAGWLEVCDIHPSPRSDIVRRRRRDGTRYVHALIMVFVMGVGAAGAGFAAAGHWVVALVLLGATCLLGGAIVVAKSVSPYPA